MLGEISKRTRFVRRLLVAAGVGVSLAFLFANGFAALAVSPNNIVSYQGRILNANGVPVADASLNMQFRLFDDVAAGTCLWSNDSSTCASNADQSVTLTDGLFSENLGDTGDGYAAIPDSVFTDNASVFLEVEISGETLSPRKLMTAAPYALNAQTLDGLDSTDFASGWTDGGTAVFLTTATDSVGIGTSTPSAQFQIEGAGSGSFAGFPALQAIIEDDQNSWSLLFQNATAGLSKMKGFFMNDAGILNLDDENIVLMSWDATGISAAAPISMAIAADVDSFPSFIDLSDNTASGSLFQLGDGTTVDGNFLPAIRTKGIGTGAESDGLLMTVEPGEDGIDDIALVVDANLSSVALANARLFEVRNDNVMQFRIEANGNITSTGTVAAADGTAGAPAFTTAGDTNTGMFHPAPSQFAFSTLGLERMRIDASGNVGIGDTTPAASLTVGSGDKFQVAGASGNVTTSGDVAVNGGDITSTGALTLTPGAGTNLNVLLSAPGDFDVNSGQLHVNTLLGNVGIDDATPNALLDIDDGTGAGRVFGILSNAGSQTGTLTGVDLNFDSGLNGTAGLPFTGVNLQMPDLTQSTGDSTEYLGYNISAGALVQNTLSGIINWTGARIGMPNITQTTGAVTSIGVKIVGGTVTSGTSYAFVSDAAAGNVGIGTTSPNAQLDVEKAEDTEHIRLSDSTNADSAGLYVGDGSAGLDGTLSAQAGSVFLDEDGKLWVNVDGATDWTDLTASSGANTALSNLASVAVNTSLLPGADDSIDLGDNTHRWRDIFLGGQTIHLGTTTVGNDEATISYNTTSNELDIGNSGFTRMLINSSGNMAMAGGVIDSSALATFNTSSGTPNVSVVSGDNADTSFQVCNSNDTNCGRLLYGHSSGSGTGIDAFDLWLVNDRGFSNGGLALGVQGGVTEYITHGGNVGIGDTTPDGKFDVDFSPAANGGTTDNATFITLNTPVDTTGTNTHNGLRVAGVIGNATGGTNTVNLFKIDDVAGDAQVTLTAANIGSLTTPTAATEKGLVIGSGWDTDLTFSDTSPVITTANGGLLSYTDGTNTLFNFADQGTYGDLGIGTTSAAVSSIEIDRPSGTTNAEVQLLTGGGPALFTARGFGGASTGGTIQLSRSSGTDITTPGAVGDGFSGGTINFQAYGDTSYGTHARIESLTVGTQSDTNHGGNLSFFTVPSGSTTVTESLTILSTGHVGIGDVDPSEAQLVVGAAGAGDIFATFATANTERLCWDGSGASLITDCTGSPGDYAEQYGSDATLEAGDIVIPDASHPGSQIVSKDGLKASKAFVAKASETYAKGMIGVVSTQPNETIGTNFVASEHPVPVALNGRIPVKVNGENGAIAVGDPITSSSMPGIGMKATEAGEIVGYALEPYDGSGVSSILVFLTLGYYPGSGTAPAAGTNNQASTLTGNLSALNMSGNIYMGGNFILDVGRIEGLSGAWSVDASGKFTTQASYDVVIKSYQGDDVTVHAVTNPEHKVTLDGTGTLVNGTAVVRFEDVDASFNDITSTTAPIRVSVTPNGPAYLYVVSKDHDGFTVQQLNGADSGITFDWFVSAYRKDYDPAVVAPADPAPPADAPPADAPPVEEPPTDTTVTDPPVDPAPADTTPPADTPTDPVPADPAATDTTTTDTSTSP